MTMSKWSGATAIAALGFSLVGSSSQADTLIYDSGGFEPTAGYIAGLALPGQPAVSTVSASPWVDQSNTSVAGSFPSTPTGTGSLVAAYAPNPTNAQYVIIQGQNLAPADAAYFSPTQYLTTPYDATGQKIAIRFTMATGTTITGAEVAGVTAFSGNDTLGSIGIDTSTGKFAGAGSTSSFTATAGTFYQYELLLDFTNHSYSVLESPNTATPFTQYGSGTFPTSINSFTDADLSLFSANGNSVSGQAYFDNYTIYQVVPEPTALSCLALGLLGSLRRRRA